MSALFSNWKLWGFLGVLFLAGLAIYSYGNSRESEGRRDQSEIDGVKYQALVDAKTQVDSALTIEREKLPPIVIRWRDRTAPSPDIRSQVDSAYREGIAEGIGCQEQLYRLAEPATLWIDTTQLTRDSLEVRTTGRIDYYPLSRDFYANIQAAPAITRTWLVTRGFILEAPPDIWSAEITIGSQVRNPSLRLGAMVFRESYGLGLDLQKGESPLYKVGARF